MSAYTQDLTVNPGASQPFSLVCNTRGVAWLIEIEHELFRQIGCPINEDTSAFVLGEVRNTLTQSRDNGN